MRRLFFLLCSVLACLSTGAENISKSEALKKAQRFMPGKHFVESKSVASSRAQTSGKPDAFYVFNADNNGGFVIVSGDDRTTEILGYSKTENLDMDRLPENLKGWLEGYVRQIEALGTLVKPAQSQKAKTRGTVSRPAIEPMIQTKWNQGTPYKLMCPDYKGRDWRDDGFATDDEGVYNVNNICVTGCVATAMAQILYYWKYPEYPNICPALDGYITRTNNWLMKALPETTFDWDAMKLSYSKNETTGASVSAIATLMRYCGQSVVMNYTIGESGSTVSPSILINVFGYNKNIRKLYRDAYTTSQWEYIIYAELAAKRPVLYSGQANAGGHQFIVDGYDGNGLFHMNWGWGGMHDEDYFVLSLADPYGQGVVGSATNSAFQFDQNALIGVKPGNNEEALIPQIESRISAMTTRDYTRTDAAADFIDVQFDGDFYAHYSIASSEALNVQVGWALCQNGEIKNVVSSKSYSFDAGITIDGFNTNTVSTFGAGLALGKYEVCQVYRYTDGAAWSLCGPYWKVNKNNQTSFLVADVTETTLTVRQVQTSFTVNSITASENPLTGSSLDVTLNITNYGETSEQVVWLWAQKEGETMWTHVATATRKIDPGESDDVVLSYKPTESGSFTLKVTNAESDEVLKITTVTIYTSFEKTVGNLKYVCHSGTHQAKVVGNTISGSTVDVSIPSTIEDNGIQFTVTEIADWAFGFCFPMVSLTIPATVESIGDYTVYNCYWLTDLKIPEGVKHIGKNAFEECHALKTVSLPSTLLSIGDGAFGNDYNLQSVVTAMESPCTIDRSVFVVDKEVGSEHVGVFSSADLYVPIGKKTVYETADVWKEFPLIKEMDTLLGDADGSGGVDADDIKAVVRYIMEGDFEGFFFDNADVVKDGKVNAADLVKIIYKVGNP